MDNFATVGVQSQNLTTTSNPRTALLLGSHVKPITNEIGALLNLLFLNMVAIFKDGEQQISASICSTYVAFIK